MGNPQSALAFDLEGPDAQDLKMPPAPTIKSPQAAGEMAELYWMALCRDVPFLEYETIPICIGTLNLLSLQCHNISKKIPLTCRLFWCNN